jgi:hypothetical protein
LLVITGARVLVLGRIRYYLYALKRRKLKRGNPEFSGRAKNLPDPFGMMLSWETLWKAGKLMEGSAVRKSRWIGDSERKTLNSLIKEQKGCG